MTQLYGGVITLAELGAVLHTTVYLWLEGNFVFTVSQFCRDLRLILRKKCYSSIRCHRHWLCLKWYIFNCCINIFSDSLRWQIVSHGGPQKTPQYSWYISDLGNWIRRADEDLNNNSNNSKNLCLLWLRHTAQPYNNLSLRTATTTRFSTVSYTHLTLPTNREV